jgi:hypothetical protein
LVRLGFLWKKPPGGRSRRCLNRIEKKREKKAGYPAGEISLPPDFLYPRYAGEDRGRFFFNEPS